MQSPPVIPSSICLGTAQFGSQIPQDDAFRMLDRFFELGGNFLDTAHIYGAWDTQGCNGGYGNSERVIGNWLQKHAVREQMYIATKGGHPDFISKESRLSESDLRREISESLDRLQCQRIDLYYLHRDDRSIPVKEIFSWFTNSLLKESLAQIGCSHWRIDRMREAMEIQDDCGRALLAASQVARSLATHNCTIDDGPYGEQLAWTNEMEVFHQQSQLMSIPYNTQAQGFFAEKYHGCDMTAADFSKPGMKKAYGCTENYRRRAAAVAIGERRGCSANQVALAYLLQSDFPTRVIIGPRSIEQLEDSMAALDIILSADDMIRLG